MNVNSLVHSWCLTLLIPFLFPFFWKGRDILPFESQFLTAVAAAKSLQSCPTLCDPIDGSPPGSPMPGILQARTLEWVQDWKRSVFIPIPKKDNAKEFSNYHTITLISHASKIMLKILQARLQELVNWELPEVQAGFIKGRGTRFQIVNICWIIEKASN